MFIGKPSSRFKLFTLTLLLVLCFSIGARSSETSPGDNVEEDLEGIEELLAIDEEEDKLTAGANVKTSSEAHVVSKAQRIVLELNTDNFKRIIDENEYVFLLGYAPWDPRSAELMPQFAEAATALKELGSTLVLAKLDSERYPNAASLLGIKGFPSLLFFVNGTSHPYSGGYTAEELVLWTRKKTGDPVIRVNSEAEAEEFLKKHHVYVLGVFDKFEGPEYEAFLDAAKSDNETQFVEASNIEAARVLFPNVRPAGVFLGIGKSEPERFTAYDGVFKKEALLDFLVYNKLPLVAKLTETNSAKIFSSPIKLQVFVFAKYDEFDNFVIPLQNIARKFKSKILFIYVDVKDENLAKPFLALFGLEDSKRTVVAAFDNNPTSKYLLESEPTESNIEAFCINLAQGTLPPYYKSMPIPDNEGTSLQVVVGKTFDDAVLSSDKNVVLEVYTPWCANCDSTAKQVEKLAKHFKDWENLVFARIDNSANEHPKLNVDSYPTLLLYRVNDKANPIKLSTRSKLKELAMSIKNHLKGDSQVTKDEL